MKFAAYWEKLGIGFSDKEKAVRLANKLYSFIRYSEENADYSDDDLYRFCLMTGFAYDETYDAHATLASLFQKNKTDIKKLIAYYIAFVNTQDDADQTHKDTLIGELVSFLDELLIPYEIVFDDGEAFIFPKGAQEFDDALVSQPLEWLTDYPQTKKTFIIALKQYSDGLYIRDIADNLRKTLETFLQEFLGNTKNLETNKTEICRYLGEQGVDPGISGLFQPLINAYKNINDRIAKHNDAVDAKLLEFLLYQTGVLIRMVLSVKQSQATEPQGV